MAVLAEKPVPLSASTPMPPVTLRSPRPTSDILGSQNQAGFLDRMQGGISKLREKCHSTWKNFVYNEVDQEREDIEELLLNIEEKDITMDEVQLRPTKEWAKRLSDYQFLSGKDNELPKRQTRSSTRIRRSHRATVMVPQITKSSSDLGYRCSRCEMVVHKGCLNGVQRCEGRARRESPILPPPHPPIMRRTSDPYPGYGSLQLLKFPWWVEKMRREEATRRLQLLPDGTFLLRWSDRLQKLVLSLKVPDDVKHMRVLRHEEANSFYLSEVRYFRTIDGLINYYRQNSLSECFSELFSTLSRPLYDTAVVRFHYQGLGANYLSLELGDRVIIISHEGESTGWWKGRIDNRVGYFPKEFVHVENNLNI